MSSLDKRSERHARVLERLAELGLAAAEDLQGRLASAKDVAEVERLALAFHRVSRCVRMTLDLEARLARQRCDLIRAERDAGRVLTETRRKQVRAVLIGDIRRETEREAAEVLTRTLDARLETELLFEDFLDGPVETLIARLRDELGLTANDVAQSPASAPSWRSSA